MSSQALAVPPATELDPLVQDLGIFLIAGRTYDPSECLRQGVDAERLGFNRVYLSERFDLKEAGALLGGVSALTSRLRVGTGIAAAGARSPLMSAALAASMQATYGGRFFLGLGRSSGPYLEGQGMDEFTFDAYEDYCNAVRRLLRGETVDGAKCVDPCPPPPPEVWTTSMGGPRASRLAARCSDGVILVPFLTADAVAKAVRYVREERERIGLDPAGITITHPIVVAPELDPEYTLAIANARLLTYLVGMPFFQKAYLERNGWDKADMDRVLGHALFQNMERATADQTFHREQMLDPAAEIPDHWISDTCAIGTVSECVEQLGAFKDAGVDELALYGSTPAENAELVAKWREVRGA